MSKHLAREQLDRLLQQIGKDKSGNTTKTKRRRKKRAVPHESNPIEEIKQVDLKQRRTNLKWNLRVLSEKKKSKKMAEIQTLVIERAKKR